MSYSDEDLGPVVGLKARVAVPLEEVAPNLDGIVNNQEDL